MMVEKHVLMIGGGIQEVEAVRQLKEEDWCVGITDRNSDCPCKKFADYLIIADGRDPESIVQSLLFNKSRNGLPKAVFTLTELTTTTAIVSKALGLPTPSILRVATSQSKALSKLCWQNAGVSTPSGVIVSRNMNISKLLNKIIYPCVVKPDISFGGKGVTLVENSKELCKALELAIKYSKSGKCVVEEYIAGSLHDANGFFSLDGKFFPLSISDRTWSNKISVEGGAVCPSNLSADQQHEFLCLFEKACRTLEIEYGPVKIDAMFDGEKFFVLEIAARLHGPRNSLFLVPNGYGKYLLPAVCEAMVKKQRLQWDFSNYKCNSAYEQITVDKEGEILNIEGIEKVREMEKVFNIQLFKNKGDKLTIPSNSSEVIGYVFAVGNNILECQQEIKKAKTTLKFHIDLGGRDNGK